MTDGFENVLIESKINNSFEAKHIFNDLSIHGFNDQNISQQLLQNFYTNEEPVYQQMGDVL